MTCPLCRDTGVIVLLTSRRPCECQKVPQPGDALDESLLSFVGMDAVPRGDGVWDVTYTWTAPDET